MTFKSGLLFVVAGILLVVYFREEKARVERKRIATQSKGIGKPKVGGPFTLVDHNGREFTHEDLKGKYALVSLVYAHCGSVGWEWVRAGYLGG